MGRGLMGLFSKRVGGQIGVKAWGGLTAIYRGRANALCFA